MYTARFFAITLVFAFAAAHTANAQNSTPPEGAGRRAAVRPAAPAGQTPSLADILDKVAWDPAERGPLLIVSPEETAHALPFQHPMTAEEAQLFALLPEAEANGEYRLPHLGEYYNRRVVNLRSLSVYAPATMSVLNSNRLPKPSAYAGMTRGDKAGLLESTFTPDQWRQIASKEGIGAGNLTTDQRELYLSLLPDAFIVDAPHAITVTEGGVSRLEPPPLASLSGDQRESVRISLRRQFNVALKLGAKGWAGVRPDQLETNLTEKPRLEVPRPHFDPTSEVLGVKIVEDVPSRLKPGQLPDDWAALDKRIDIGAVTTIGDLVRLIAKQTGAELYCDPRYEDRKLYIRGSSAQAGDICRALAWGVTGTWRRLDKAFVLTDDLVGLGARHALIDIWIRENVLLIDAGNRKIQNALKSSRFEDYIGWPPGDPTAPGDALSAKLAANNKVAEANRAESLFVPMGELSPEAQAAFSHVMDQKEAEGAQFQKAFPNRQIQESIDRSGVYLSIDFQGEYLIPGVGSVNSADLGNLSPQTSRFSYGGSGHTTATGGAIAHVPPPLAFPQATIDRVLLVAPTDPGDLVKIAQAAHRGGFTQLWVATDRGDTGRIGAAIQAGNSNGLRVQAVVSLTRQAPADKPEWEERTLLGETLTGYARRWQSQLADLRLPEDPGPDTSRGSIMNQEPTTAWGKEMVVAQMLHGGDFVRCDDLEATQQIVDGISRTAAVNGLGGIVFRDIAAPGFNPPIAPGVNFGISNDNPGTDPLLTMGYSDATRLACLRKEGFDPADLSPLMSGERINLPPGMHSSGPPPDISLPFFHDYGASARNSRVNGQSRVSQGAKDAWERWCALRQDLDSKFIASIAAHVRGNSPPMTVMTRRTLYALEDNMVYYGSLEGPVDTSATSATGANPAKPAGPDGDILRTAARAASRISYSSLKYEGTLGAEEATKRFLNQLPYSLKDAAGWEGIVVDLSDAPVNTSLELLAALPEAPRAPVEK